ncbi:transporter substrate-binding domain-containing protein [Moritella sp. Urea-trap-13]|uniref:transporter substrate-binding domain-containing protein n=1 Tax=Moritella sp. Urea-trap-13 TaxID=2058327 RepID=UPI000C32BEC1|nr:transporter substrate-binding domain-containing protein [Moritella sp. Urea-trap-13]PKH04707.1 amino acid ABC transporter [Moritella sp. Urea-trap-13]
MKRFISIMLTLQLCIASFTANSESINYYVIAKQAMPFQITTDDEQHSGIVSDIIAKIFMDKYTVNYHVYPFNRMISKLEAGGEKNWVTYGSPNWGSVQAENLSDKPIYTVSHSILSNAKSDFSYTDISDIKDKVFVLLYGFDYPTLQPYIDSGVIQELRVKDYAAAFRILDKMPNDAIFIEMTSRIKYNLKIQSKDLSSYHLQNFSALIPTYPIYLAFDPNMDSELQLFINRQLSALEDAGTLTDIINHYI